MIARHFARSGWIALVLFVLVTAMGVANNRGIKLDFANYYDVGQKASAGEFDQLYDPFAPIAGKPPFGNMSFLGPPLTAYLYIPLTWMDPRTGINVFKFAGAFAQFAALFLIWRECRPLAGPSKERQGVFFATFAWAALAFQPLQAIFVVGGQTTPFAFLLATLGWLAFRRDRMVWTALAVSGAVILKPGFAIAAIILFFWSSNSFRIAACMAGLAFVAASGLVLGPDINLAFFAQTARESDFVQAPWMNSNPFGWVEALFVPPEEFRVDTPRPSWLDMILVSVRLTGVALLMLFAFRIWRSDIDAAEKRSAVFLTALTAALVFSPTVWSHYLMLTLPMIAVLLALADRLPVAVRATLAAIIALSVFQNFRIVSKLQDWFDFDSRSEILAIGLAKSAPLLLMLGLLLFAGDAIAAALRPRDKPPATPEAASARAARS